MADNLKTYSLLFAWADNDREQGEFGTIVRAINPEEAEAKGRADMRENHISNHCDSDADEEEVAGSCAEYEHTDLYGDVIFGGRLIECHEGAIWKAADLEKALRGLLVQVDEMATRCGWCDHGERETARKLIAEIDAL